MRIRQVRQQAPSTNTTQDYTVAGFGTPDWCIVIWGGVAESAWSSTEDSAGIGFYDGTNQYTVSHGYEHGSTPGSGITHSQSAGDKVLRIDWDSVDDRRTATAAFITNGVRLTWGGGSTAHRPYTTVIMGKGGTAEVGFHQASASDQGTSTESGLSIAPDVMFLASRTSDTLLSDSGDHRYSVGFAVDNGASIDQRCRAMRVNDANPMDYNAHVSSNRAVAIECNTAGGPTLVEITGMSANGFGTKTHGSSSFGSSFVFMAIQLDAGDTASIITGTTPTAAGDWDPGDMGHYPQWVFMLPTAETTLDSNRSSAEDVVEEFGFYSITREGQEYGHYLVYGNGETTTSVGQGRSDERLEINTVASSAPSNLVAGAAPTFDDSGLVYADANFTHDSSARKALILSMGVSPQVIIRSSCGNWDTNDITPEMDSPASIVAGDLLVALMIISVDDEQTITPPTGWTEEDTVSHATPNKRYVVFTKIATATDVSNAGTSDYYIFSGFNGTDDIIYGVFALYDPQGGTLQYKASSLSGSWQTDDGTTTTAPSQTISEDGSRVIAAFAQTGSLAYEINQGTPTLAGGLAPTVHSQGWSSVGISGLTWVVASSEFDTEDSPTGVLTLTHTNLSTGGEQYACSFVVEITPPSGTNTSIKIPTGPIR